MKLIRYLESIELLKSENQKQSNGTYKKSFTKIDDYKVQVKTLDDEVDATIYGANINKMFSINTPLQDLEEYLIPKVDNVEDNISLYFIQYKNSKYKIVSVTKNEIKIERI